MISNFQDKLTEDVFNGWGTNESKKLPRGLHKRALRLLDQLNAATKIDILKACPLNIISNLEGSLSNFWRVEIDEEWAVIFRWEDDTAYDVCITNSH